MKHTIVVPFANEANDAKIINCCTRHGVKATKMNVRGQNAYQLSTDDVSNFYWLGANMEKSLK